MDSNNKRLLEKAKAYVYAWKVLEAYNIFRRYFDRLPFQPETEHAEYIALFVRVLFELGKEFELKFYLTELERLYEKNPAPFIAYPLAVVYSYSGLFKMEAARGLFETIVKNPAAKAYHAKSKMMLADYYDRKDNILACRMLIDSIEVPEGDVSMARLVEIWKALVERREGNFDAARTRLEVMLRSVTIDTDWYAYFSLKVGLTMTYLESNDAANAKRVISEVDALFAGRKLKMVQTQIDAIHTLIAEKNGLGAIRFKKEDGEISFSYANKTLLLKKESPAEKLLVLLVKRKFLDKAVIVKNLYDRQYIPEQDDKLIYYHIHALRKRLKTIGLPAEAITSEENGYRLTPEIESVGGES